MRKQPVPCTRSELGTVASGRFRFGVMLKPLGLRADRVVTYLMLGKIVHFSTRQYDALQKRCVENSLQRVCLAYDHFAN